MRSVRPIRSIAPERAWEQLAGGEAELLDLRTELERRRYGWPPGVRPCLVDPAHRLARCCEHDLPLPARKPLEAHRMARRGRGWRRLARLAGCRPANRAAPNLTGPLPQDEFDWIFSRVPRLTVEVLIASSDRGVLLALRDSDPWRGPWHLPGGTVRLGEPITEAVRRVARDELGVTVSVGELLGCTARRAHPRGRRNAPKPPASFGHIASVGLRG